MTKKKKKPEVCENCGADLKSKYMIRVELHTGMLGPILMLESTTKKSIVGWIKHLVDEYDFEEIRILNLMTECPVHEKYWKNKLGKI